MKPNGERARAASHQADHNIMVSLPWASAHAAPIMANNGTLNDN